MASLNLRTIDKLQGWICHEDDQMPSSNNMLRVLQSKMLNCINVRQRSHSTKLPPSRSQLSRPATVRARPVTPSLAKQNQFISYPTIDLANRQLEVCENRAQKSMGKFQIAIKRRNKSMGNQYNNHKGNRNQNDSRNKQNKEYFTYADRQRDRERERQRQKERQRERQKYKTEELEVKKQTIMFKNCYELKSKNSQKIITNFHEMEIKLRKNRMQNNRSAQGQKQKIHIVMQPNGKITQIRINNGLVTNNYNNYNQGTGTENNLVELGIEKHSEGHYTKLSRNYKLMLVKDKMGNMEKNKERNQGQVGSYRKKDKDLFTDVHFQ